MRPAGRPGAASITIALAALGALPPSARAQAPTPVERDVTVGSTPLALPGTLTLPAGTGPFPLVVLVHGSGPNDRDETVGPNRPFRDLARGLSARGVAVLRYDKRTRVYPMSFANRAFTVREETTDDALAAIRLARTFAEIDARRIVVAGHSLGGMLAPRIAAEDGKLAGVIVLGGAADESLPDMVERQLAHLKTLDGADTTALAAQERAIGPLLARVRALTPADSADKTPLLGAPAAYWLDLAAYVPLDAARALDVPLFVIQGGRDYQVDARGFERWQAGLGGRPHVTTRMYPALNHLFMTGSGPGNPGEYAVPGTVAEEVIGDIAAWTVALTPR